MDGNEGTDHSTAAGFVDWGFASRAAQRLVSPGPSVSRAEAGALVRELTDAAERAQEPVARTARMSAPPLAEPARVVDRRTWIDENVTSMRGMLGPALDEIMAKRQATLARHQAAEVPAFARRATGRMAGAELAGVLAFVSGKVLGQYDLAPGGTPQLLLVAPNILEAERQLKVDPHDFRLWVALHEETHRVQFTAVPWLREHMITEARRMAVEMVPEPDQLVERTSEIARRLPEVFQEDGLGLQELVITPEQRERLADLTAVMSLLEGHADVVMDEVGPQVVPSVEEIRRRFTERRKGAGAVDRLLRRLLGLDAKMRQYRDGAVFVRHVTERVGVDGFNRVWESPETLPRGREITDPDAYLRRVHGQA